MIPGTWYHSALADAIAGDDFIPSDFDVFTLFNPLIDTDPGCLGGGGWYYGLDHNPGPGQQDFLAVLLHEFGHGVGHSSSTDDETGEEPLGFPGIYDVFLHDNDLGINWPAMTDGERQASALNCRNVVWDGAEVTAAAASFLNPRHSADGGQRPGRHRRGLPGGNGPTSGRRSARRL